MHRQTSQRTEPMANTSDIALMDKNPDIEQLDIEPNNKSASDVEITYPPKSVLVILTLALMLVVAMSGLDTNIIGMSRTFDDLATLLTRQVRQLRVSQLNSTASMMWAGTAPLIFSRFFPYKHCTATCTESGA